MRADPTDAEKNLWRLLRDRRLAGHKFRRQYPAAGYILDFYCARARLAVELDGSQHADADAAAYDARRTAALGQLGIRVLRFWDHDLLKHPDLIADRIYDALHPEEPSPRPSPGVPGEGDGDPGPAGPTPP